ncbi:MAG: isocitrate lyase/phosphoenolpyruvate mutase family protein [Burkholderiaceae bacterium]|nr:MAG: isocitrate lyase/phosphoenolpyruvate mutase family protein [Burkholderiaceae bacterium]TAM05194.1 MAG: isocitrate lyase/phosphoenolpyruvate mutase family protein [Pusillimonas sp.]
MSAVRAAQKDKAAAFRALHEGPRALLIPNPWDIGSARVLASLGFQALATSSGASACVFGRHDGELSRDEALEQAQAIVAATDLPVSADLERGWGDAPEAVAETVRLAAEAGLVGCSIEDTAGHHPQSQYAFDLAVARIEAAVAAARSLGFAFTLTARAENFVCGNPDLDDTIHRLQAYERAGADVLFAIGLPSLDAVRKVCAAVSRPVNFMAGVPGHSFSVAELESAGVKRISFGTSLYRSAMSAFVSTAREIRETGQFGYIDRSLARLALNDLITNTNPGV